VIRRLRGDRFRDVPRTVHVRMHLPAAVAAVEFLACPLFGVDIATAGAGLRGVGRLDLLDLDAVALFEIGEFLRHGAAAAVGEQPVHPPAKASVAEVELLDRKHPRPVERHRVIQHPVDLGLDHRPEAGHQLQVTLALPRLLACLLHSRRFGVGAFGDRLDLSEEPAAEEVAEVGGKERPQAEVQGQHVGERMVGVAAFGEDLGEIPGERRFQLAVVTEEEVHRLAERARTGEPGAAAIVAIAPPAIYYIATKLGTEWLHVGGALLGRRHVALPHK